MLSRGKVIVQRALEMRLNDEEKYEQHDVSLTESDNKEQKYTLLLPVSFGKYIIILRVISAYFDRNF